MQRNRCVQHFHNAVCGYACARQHNRNHRQHQEAHDNDHGIRDKRCQVTDLHGARVDVVSADPNNQNRNAVHDKHHNRHHKGHRTVGKQLGLKQILIRLIKALFLVLFPTECANRHNAGQHFTGDQIQAVYQLLHDFKFRHRDAGQRADARHHDNNGENNCPAHAGAGLDYHDNAADCDNRRVQHHAQQHDRNHLNLLNIIGRTRNQRRCRKFFHLCIGKLHDLLVNGSAQIASDF